MPVADCSTFKVRAPSNIAFVKYWGKTGRQLPLNPSLSMTLSDCVTDMSVRYELGQSADAGIKNYVFEGQDAPAFQSRISKFLDSIVDVFPLAAELSLSIESENSFPHSAGIASSASAFGALGFALAHIELEQGLIEKEGLLQRASFLARLGSGSAGRSIDGPYTVWGQQSQLGACDEYAVPYEQVHDNFKDVRDAVLLIDEGEKSVSSSAGHALMNGHVYRDARIEQANQNIVNITEAMKVGDWEQFGVILESEALSLHAMMMTSNPSYILMAPQTINAIELVRSYRAQQNVPLYFTLDAGANIHLIYAGEYAKDIEPFVQEVLKPLCQNEKIIFDKAGQGACLIG
jgi:diphosphomevalonate decarboxylase